MRDLRFEDSAPNTFDGPDLTNNKALLNSS